MIGLSRFVQRRVLVAADNIEDIETIHIATNHEFGQESLQIPKLGKVYSDWATALVAVRPGLVYVSGVNSVHADIARCALLQGHHVVVDKPGFPDESTSAQIVELAASLSLIVAEATCYGFHPLFKAVKTIVEEAQSTISTACAIFTPPVPVEDWRWQRGFGGGAVMDTGPYAVSLGRILWNVAPRYMHAVVSHREIERLDESYSMLGDYGNGRTIIGHFGFTTSYQNSLRLMGDQFTIEVDRAFSAPPELAVSLKVQDGSRQYVETLPAADSMREFLVGVLQAVSTNSTTFADHLLADARVLDRLRVSAAIGPGEVRN